MKTAIKQESWRAGQSNWSLAAGMLADPDPKLLSDLGSGVIELLGTVQHYSWGDKKFIPKLIGATNSEGKPFAELWMGAHPDAPSWAVLRSDIVSLRDLHAKIYEFYMALNQDGASGEIARAIAGVTIPRDAQGNLIVNSQVAPEIKVRNSVLINAALAGRSLVEGGVLIDTRAVNVEVREGFDVLSTVADLKIEPRGGTYKVVAHRPVHAGSGERLTTLFLPSGPQLFRVKEETDLKDKARNYAVPFFGNPLSFEQAHAEMGALAAEDSVVCRRAAEAAVSGFKKPSRRTAATK